MLHTRTPDLGPTDEGWNMAIQIYNVLSKKKEPFTPIRENEVSIYVCGVTVYGRCHVGHLRCYLSFDAILRYFAYRGFKVNYVRNFTDIDDKIIARANEIAEGKSGEWRTQPAYETYDAAMWNDRLAEDDKIRRAADGDPRHLAEVVSDHFIDIFHNEDFGPFDLFPTIDEPRVSEHILQVVSMIEQIVERGFAYESEGDVYFDVPTYHEKGGAYGKLSGRDYTQMMEGARVSASEKKRHGTDFALWKKASDNEPGWDSPWGRGRPGWHIECSAMSLDKFKGTFDIHGGGKDLIFPHHENEIAQSEAATGEPFCNAWMHNGFVTVDGVKMSKSLGNFVTIKEGLTLAPEEVWRLLILSTHYANPIDLSRTREIASEKGAETVRGTIDIAWDRLEYFYETLAKADALISAEPLNDAAPLLDDPRATSIVSAFVEVMDDDFNTARAVAGVGESMKYLNELCDMKAKAVKGLKGGREAWLATIAKAATDLREVLGAMNLCRKHPKEALDALRSFALQKKQIALQTVEQKLAERQAARAAKDFAKSDAVRDELLSYGIEVRDTQSGMEWKVVR